MQLRGLFVAIVTPFRDGGLDEAALAAHASWLVDEGASGIVVCGTPDRPRR
jgi:4-hydroxy-tetrahydrodipicolinate synthase